MPSEISNLGSSGSAEQLANDSEDSSAEPPASSAVEESNEWLLPCTFFVSMAWRSEGVFISHAWRSSKT